MNEQELCAQLKALLNDHTLFEENRLEARKEAIDLIAYAGDVIQVPGWHDELNNLYHQVLDLQKQLQGVNANLFQRVRNDLLSGNYTPESLRMLFNHFTQYRPYQRGQPDYEYDGLDELLEQVLFPGSLPAQGRERAADMIRYEATPARVILELVDTIKILPEDVFVDIGSGLGLVVMLVNLLTGIRALGVEYDPVYCQYAQKQADDLGLKKVSFINADAQSTDLNEGNIFYLFTPFVNQIFDNVLERLRYTSLRKSIYICSYGTITYEIAKLRWLQIMDPAMEHDFKLAVFTSK